MTGMQLYIKFLFTVSFGLLGLGMVLTTLLETVLHDWDIPREVRRWWRHLNQSRSHAEGVRAEDILLEIENNRKEHRYERRPPTRLIDRRREALREVREAEERLSSPHAA